MSSIETTAAKLLNTALSVDASGPVTVPALDLVVTLSGVFTSCPACGSEPWANIDCAVCAVMGAVGEVTP